MITKTLEIVNKLGLHARSSSVFVKRANAFGSQVTVSNEFGEANGKSIMSMMMLQASFGTTIEVSVSGDDEVEALESISTLVNDRFGEAE